MAKENNISSQEIINEALEFEQIKLRSLSTSDRIEISRKAKTLILGLNEMKRLTVIKQRVEKRLKGKPLTATS